MRDETGRDAWFSPAGIRGAIFFLAVFFRVTHDGLIESGNTRSRLDKLCMTFNGLQAPSPFSLQDPVRHLNAFLIVLTD